MSHPFRPSADPNVDNPLQSEADPVSSATKNTTSDLHDESSSSDSSTSSADSVASVNTLKPGPNEHAARWTNYFTHELNLEHRTDDHASNAGPVTAKYHVYLTPPTNPQKDPLFICHHGAGASGLSFAILAREIRRILPTAGILSLEARGHGSVVTDVQGTTNLVEYSLPTLTSDARTMITLTSQRMGWHPTLPPIVLVGHSLGGAIAAQLAADYALGNALIGFCVIDVVEGSALEALTHMKTYLSSRPSRFASEDEAIHWHLRTRTIRDRESAQASVPSLLVHDPSTGDLIWKTDLPATQPWWPDWFQGMSAKFLRGRGAKLLVLAGTDRLDRELMIGQMQGKFQLVVVPEAGHFVQEDVPAKLAGVLVEFFHRNDRSALVLPPKVSDLLAQGKKV